MFARQAVTRPPVGHPPSSAGPARCVDVTSGVETQIFPGLVSTGSAVGSSASQAGVAGGARSGSEEVGEVS